MKFVLEIELGNEAIESPNHVADALERTILVIAERYSIFEIGMNAFFS